MARSILLIVCLSFLLLYQFIDCETQGNISQSLVNNIGISINHSSSPIVRNITPISLNTIAETLELSRNITPISLNTIAQTLEIPKTIEYKARIVRTPSKPGAPAAKPGAPAAKTSAAAAKTIKYRLGKRVAGTQIRLTREVGEVPFSNGVFLNFISGDRLVASNALIQQWTAAQNVTQNLNYPRTGTGSTITYIEIIVEQVSFT